MLSRQKSSLRVDERVKKEGFNKRRGSELVPLSDDRYICDCRPLMGENIKCNLILRGKIFNFSGKFLKGFCNDLRFGWQSGMREGRHGFKHFL